MRASIGWLVPSLIEGSGGIREIINKINALVLHGYECHAYVNQPDPAEAIADQIETFYGGSLADIHAGWDLEHEHDLVFATIWWSAESVAATPNLKAYLIQDFEPFFNPMGEGYLRAERSYRLGLTPIVLGRWLPALLNSRFGARARFFDFCAETDRYFPLPNRTPEDLSVCFIHQPEKPRRCADIGLAALDLLKRALPDVRIYLYGANARATATFDHVNLGILHGADINRLYNQAAVGFCISSSNPSRIPFEMMAAGLPVVDIWRENNLYDFPEDGVLLGDPTPEALAKTLHALLLDPERRRRMAAFGPTFMHDRSMAVEYAQFLDAVDRLFDDTFARDLPAPPEPCYRQPAFRPNSSL
jgi:glycosyltransferase involved in cell wall biosynthesis